MHFSRYVNSKGMPEGTPVELQILCYSDAFTMDLYIKNYMYTDVNYIIAIQNMP